MSILKFQTPAGDVLSIAAEQMLLAGYAGRNRADVEAHVLEMRRLGVPVPAELPVFYRAMPCLLTQVGSVDVVGLDTRPEVEFVLFAWNGRRYVTVGNDQFDLAVERHGWGEKSKNLCQKIVAGTAWPVDEVMPHWDRLVLELCCNDELLQQGCLDMLLEPHRLLERAGCQASFDTGGILLFSGTIPALRAPGADMRNFCMKLRDPVLGREIVAQFVLRDISGSFFRRDAVVPA